jgi:hypothetical protein
MKKRMLPGAFGAFCARAAESPSDRSAIEAKRNSVFIGDFMIDLSVKTQAETLPIAVLEPYSRRNRRWCALRIFIGDAYGKRIDADMIAGPAWTLKGRAFSAATSAARAGTQFVG